MNKKEFEKWFNQHVDNLREESTRIVEIEIQKMKQKYKKLLNKSEVKK